jgi:dTMP kinase
VIQSDRWVICDRFLDSSIAYQGGGDGLGAEVVRELHRIGSANFLPDRTLLLALPPGEAATRAARRDGEGADRIGGRGEAYHARVAAAFEELAAAEPGRFRRIDARGTPEQVTGRLIAALADLLP